MGIEKADVQATVESFMKEVISSLENGENVYLRAYGSFIVKTRDVPSPTLVLLLQPVVKCGHPVCTIPL